jgi:hemin uptake protein HemP
MMNNSEVKSVVANADTPNRITTEQLFAGTNQVIIVHKGEEYRLRITSNDKLILTK